MTAGFFFVLSRLRLILLPLLLSGAFAATAFAQSSAPAPLYRFAGRTSGKVLAKSAATTAAGQTAPTGRATTLDRASLASVASLREGMAVALPVTDAETVSGKVNMVVAENGWTRSGGSLDNSTPGTFYLATDGARTEGFILRPDLQTAYRFEPQATGETVLREVPLNAVVCGFLPPFLNDPSQSKVETNALQPAIVPPILNSRPSAASVVYLDFDGEVVQDPAWAGGARIVAQPPNVSPDDVIAIFNRVKEDYWPFNLNVTTDVSRYNRAAVGKRMRCIITPTNTAAPGAGGVAYLYSFSTAGKNFSTTIPCWVFNGGVVGIAEAVSHELGHTFGLSHDGRELPSGHEEYFLGHGSGPTSWCPIMGASYYVSVSQWSRGEYQYANNQEDDVAMISSTYNGFGYVPDEAGDTLATSKPLTGTQGGVVTQPGVITRAGEGDLFSFTTSGGQITLSTVLAPVPNLDAQLELLDENGQSLLVSNPANTLPATLTTTVVRGAYYLRVTDSGAGDVRLSGYSTYGSIGAYTITGKVPGLGSSLLPNLALTTPPDAADKLVISNEPGTRTEPQTFFAQDSLYLDFSVTNNGDGAADPTQTAIYVDDVLKGSVPTPSLEVGAASTTEDYNIGMLPVGEHLIRLQADNGGAQDELSEVDNSYVRDIYVDVPGQPHVYGRLSADGQVNALFYYQIRATNSPTSYSADNLPPGLYLKDNTNVITGTPTTVGDYQATITATNDEGSDSKTLTIHIAPAVPAIANPGSLTGEKGVAFTYQIEASNEPDGYGAIGLPPGLDLDRATGIISGTPTTPGDYQVTVQAANASGTGTATFVIQILVAAPKFTSANTARGRVGQPFSFQVKADNVTGGYGATSLPDGLTFDPATGIISGTPTVAGTYPVTVTATNDNRTVESTLTLTITEAPPIAAWGLAEAIAIPADLDMADVVALAAGAAHSLALKGDGTVEAWGANSSNQLNVPAGLTNVVAVSAGAYHSLALRKDGTVVAWGANDQGQATVPTGLSNVIAIAAGQSHSLALRADGTVIGWGSNSLSQAQPPIGLHDVTGIAAGGYHSLAVKGDGSVVGWGSNNQGQITIPDDLQSKEKGANAKQVAAGLDFSLILRADGGIAPLGSNTAGQLLAPTGLKDATYVAAGGQHALAVRQDGSVVAWGTNTHGESTPPTVLYNVALVAAGTSHSLALVQPGEPRAFAVMPVTASGVAEGSISLVAYGTGTGPVSYQWAHNGVDIANATYPYLELSPLTVEQAGAYTFRLTNPTGSVISTAATVTVQAAPPAGTTTVTVVATRPSTAVGSPTPGEYTLTRTGDTTQALTVQYTLGGNARNGTDYKQLTGIRRIPAGQASATIKVVPQGLLGGVPQRIVKLKLKADANYTVGTVKKVKVRINGAQQ